MFRKCSVLKWIFSSYLCIVICGSKIVFCKECSSSVQQAVASCSYLYHSTSGLSCSVMNDYLSCVDAMVSDCDMFPIQKSTLENGKVVVGKYCNAGISQECNLQSSSQCNMVSTAVSKEDIYPCSSYGDIVTCASQLTTDCKLPLLYQSAVMKSILNVLETCSVQDPCVPQRLRDCYTLSYNGSSVDCSFYTRYLECIEERSSNCTVPLLLLPEIGSNRDLQKQTCEGIEPCSVTELLKCISINDTGDYCRNLNHHQACFNGVRSSGCSIPSSLQPSIDGLLENLKTMCTTFSSGTCSTRLVQCFAANSTEDPCIFYTRFTECIDKEGVNCNIPQTLHKQIGDYRNMMDKLCEGGGMCSTQVLQGCFAVSNLEDPCAVIRQYEECFLRMRSSGCSIPQEFQSQMDQLLSNLTDVCGTSSSNTCPMDKTMHCFAINNTNDRCAMLWIFRECLQRLTSNCSLAPKIQSIINKSLEGLPDVCKTSSGRECNFEDYSACLKTKSDSTLDYCKKMKTYITCVDSAVSGCNLPSDTKSSLYKEEDRQKSATCSAQGVLFSRRSELVVFFGLIVLYLLKM